MARIEQHREQAGRKGFRGIHLRTSGFTLLELLVVVGILAALVALALPYYQDYMQQSRITAAQADLQMFCKALQMYDSQEASVFGAAGTNTGPDFRPLIGKYLQDYRKTTTQVMPFDPWGNEYVVRAVPGTIITAGGNGAIDTTDVTSRVAAGDDILITWKPGYYVTTIRAVNLTTVDVTFSRKAAAPIATGLSLGAITSTAVQKINDYKYRFTVPAMTAGTAYTGTVTFVAALDGAAAFDANPFDDGSGTNGGVRRFIP